MTEITHERCSELLGPYAAGDLGDPERAVVETHLKGCEACTQELAGLQALQAFQVEPMTGAERDRLTQNVRAAVTPAPKVGLLGRFGHRLAPALGALALVAIAAVALISLPQNRPVPAEVRGSTADEDSGAGGTATREAAPKAAAQEESTAKGAAAGTSSDAASSAGGQADTAAGQTTTMQADAMVERDAFRSAVQPFARTGIEIRSVVPTRSLEEPSAEAYSGTDFAASAPTEALADQVRECSASTVDSSPHPLVPTAATYYPDDVLVITFVWLEPSTTRLNYEIHGWIGGRCDLITPIFRSGVLE